MAPTACRSRFARSPARAPWPPIVDLDADFVTALSATRPAQFNYGAADEYAAAKRALAAVVALAPDRLAGRGFRHSVVLLDEAIMELMGAAWYGGLRAGQAVERLAQAVREPRQICGRCDGFGWVRSDFVVADASGATACPACGEQGAVMTPAPTL